MCVIFSGFLVDDLSVLVFFKIKVLKIEFLVSIRALKYPPPPNVITIMYLFICPLYTTTVGLMETQIFID